MSGPLDKLMFSEGVTYSVRPATAMDGGNTGNSGAVFSATAMDGGNTGNAGAVFSALVEGLMCSVRPELVEGCFDKQRCLSSISRQHNAHKSVGQIVTAHVIG